MCNLQYILYENVKESLIFIYVTKYLTNICISLPACLIFEKYYATTE